MWLPEEQMADIHIIRQDYARARKAYETDFSQQAADNLQEQADRRARAIRSLNRDDNVGVRHLSAMFSCSKSVVRTILAEEPE